LKFPWSETNRGSKKIYVDYILHVGSPRGVAVDYSGNVFVTDRENNCVRKYNPLGELLTEWGRSEGNIGPYLFTQIDGIAVDVSSGRVYVADCNSTKLQVFYTSGEEVPNYVRPHWEHGYDIDPAYYHPQSHWNSYIPIAVDGQGNVYSTGIERTNLIDKYNPQGKLLYSLGSSGSGNCQFNNPVGIAVDSTDNVYVVDQNNYRIQKFNSSGEYQTKWGTKGYRNGQFQCPQGIAVDSSGNVYVTDWELERVQKFNSSGEFLTKWGNKGEESGQFIHPEGIAVDCFGNVYVADTGNRRVQKFNSKGNFEIPRDQ
jgi:tripartite motif-containing protein 71